MTSSSSTTTAALHEEEATNYLPLEVLAKVFPFLRNDATSWYTLAHCGNRQLHQISRAVRPPRKWPDLLVNWERNNDDDDNDDNYFDYYVHQVKYSPPRPTLPTQGSQNNKNEASGGRHMAIMLRIYKGREAVNYHRVVRIVDIDQGPIQDIPVGRSTPFTAYCGDYFVAAEPRRVCVYKYTDDSSSSLQQQQSTTTTEHYQLVNVLPSVDRIVGIRVFDESKPKIVLQTESGGDDFAEEPTYTLAVWGLLEGGRFEGILPYTGKSSFCLSEDCRVFCCMDGGSEGRSVTSYFFQPNTSGYCYGGPYILDLPGNPRRSWIDACKLSPDGTRCAVLTEDVIFQLDVSVEPPQWIEGCCFRAPDGCAFSGQVEYTPDSKRLVAHARTNWTNVYNNDNTMDGGDDTLNTIQIWNAAEAPYPLLATKGFHDLVGSVGLSPDAKFVIVIQGDESDVFRSAIQRIVTRYIGAMEDHIPYPETGDEQDEEAAERFSSVVA